MVTIRDIARELGLGKSTVQRALMGHAGSSAATRTRVAKTAEALGYRLDPLYSILGSQSRQSRSRPLAIAYLDRAEIISRTPRYAGVKSFASAKVRGAELGYELEHLNPQDLGEGQSMMDELYDRGYAGVIIGQMRSPDHAAILADKYLPVVSCGRLDALPIHTVQPDIPQMVCLAWRQMLNAGCRHIGPGFGLHDPPVSDDWERLGTIVACQQETLAKEDRVPALLHPLGDRAALLEWFHRHKPDAVLGFSSRQYFDLRDAGVNMSRVAFAALHAPTDVGDTLIAGIIEASSSISHQAVNLLDRLIRRRIVGIPAEPLRILMPGHWKEGSSLHVRPARKAGK